MSAAAASSGASVAAGTPLLTAEKLTFAFGSRVVLDEVSFAVHRGEILGLLGPNGAGKSTAFRLLSGQILPAGGSLRWSGRPASTQDPNYRARLGVVFQEPSLDLALTARENLALGAAIYGVRGDEARRAVSRALEAAGLVARANERTKTFSGGMRRRLEIARVLLHRPALLLLDEPGRGVDPEALSAIWHQLESERREHGLAIIVTSHQPEEAERCDRVVFLDSGRVIAEDSPEGLRRRVAGDLLRVVGRDPVAIAAAIRERLALEARVLGTEVLVEVPAGHAWIPRVVELFPAGALDAVSLTRPSLADVFAKLTGRGFVGVERPSS
jgi:ABC-2 type transport system ATP-binding protein